MDDSLRLSLSQRQQQTLAPMQLQFVRLLEMNGAEAEEEVRRALDENPALEAAEPDRESGDSHEGADDLNDFNESAEQLQMADYRSEDDIPYYRLSTSNRSADDRSYEPLAVSSGESLFTHLMKQLAEDPAMTERQMEIARVVVGNIDDNGYIERTTHAIVDDLAIQESIDADESEVRNVIDRVRALEPAGVCAVDLRDSLMLQLRRRAVSPAVTLATEIVRDYFDLFSLMHFDRIASLTGADKEQVKAAMDVIRSLNPKPGTLITGDDDERTRHISPDFLVEADGDRLTLTLLSNIPALQIEQSFAPGSEIVKPRKTAAGEAANAFIRQKRDEAQTFIRVVEMRRATLMRVMGAIMQWQRDFFLTDDRRRLRPMVLRDIAAVTGDDLSVISRATTGKYVATAQGIYAVKSLFNERRKEGDETSSQVVIDRLREIIASENTDKPLSDEAITRRLQDEGFDIARRTVAKYRERLGIPVGRLRRKI